MQNNIGKNFESGQDLKDRLPSILAEVAAKIGFTEPVLAGTSSWWGSEKIGAARYRGYWNGKPAMMKIQGVPQQISEALMLSEFARHNASKKLRPPHLFLHIPWDEKKQYEIIVHEAIDGQKVVNVPATTEEISHYFELYAEYRTKCRSHPWIPRPDIHIGTKIAEAFALWKRSSESLYPGHPLRQASDAKLVDEAVRILQNAYILADLEFVHAHFSTDDLIHQGDQVVVFSNLYWSWRPPLYDAALAYHWHIYHQARVKNATQEQVDQQRALWSKHLEQLPQQQHVDSKFLDLTLLERAAAGLLLDALTVPIDSPIAEYLVELTRNDLKRLLQ